MIKAEGQRHGASATIGEYRTSKAVPTASEGSSLPARNGRRVALLAVLALMTSSLRVTAQASLDSSASLIIKLDGHDVSLAVGNADGAHMAIVQLGSHHFSVPVGTDTMDPAAVPDLRAMTTTKDGYLFIESNNGGNGWRADTKNVFAIRNGNLVHLGEIEANQSPNEFQRFPALRRPVRFIDIDNQLETNRLTSHAEAPVVLIALKEQNGRFTYDPTWCWRLNAAHYKDLTDQLASSSVVPPGEDSATPFLSLAFIDKYCGLTRNFHADLARAQRDLPDKTYRELISILDKVNIGRLPR